MKKIVTNLYIFLSILINMQAATSRPQPEYKDFIFLVNSDIHQSENTSRRDAQKLWFLQDVLNRSITHRPYYLQAI
ncbi:MAG: hypothetical protein WC192_00830 [Candidatus Babeliales bacterium]